MTSGAAFLLEPSHLGRNARGEVWLHASLTEMLNGILEADGYDLLDEDGMRLVAPARPAEFTAPVEPFETGPAAPRRIAVYDTAPADRVAAAFPAMRRLPLAEPEGYAFELEDAHLCVDPFGFTHLAPDLANAVDACRRHMPQARVQVLEGDGVPHAERLNEVSEPLTPLATGPGAEVLLNGFEPRYIAFADAHSAEDFARAVPGLRRWRLADLERIWRQARRPSGR